MAAKQLVREVALVLGITLAGAVAVKALHPRSPAWFLVVEIGENAVTEKGVQERWNGEVLWVDARPAAAFQKRHREGAILLNEEGWNELLSDQFNTLASADKPIVVYCDGARCEKSRTVAEKLRALGIPEVYYLQGGWRK